MKFEIARDGCHPESQSRKAKLKNETDATATPLPHNRFLLLRCEKADPLGAMLTFAEELIEAGATILQYRDKSSNVGQFLSNARELRLAPR